MALSPTSAALAAEPLTLDSALEQAEKAALTDSSIGLVGLEVETHLLDLVHVRERVDWRRIEQILPVLGAAVGGTAVGGTAISVEPGGQIEFSGPPAADVTAAIQLMRDEVQHARLALLPYQLGLAHLGADPARPPQRVNPKQRYQAMERHYAATGRAAPGAVMMNSTAALQLNLQAGPASAWATRVAQAHRLGPTLLALSACSPWLAGRDTGWRSRRQQAWFDLARAQGTPNGFAEDPAGEWARYAIDSPVLYTRVGDDVEAVPAVVPFRDWASGRTRLRDRLPRAEDLDLHLSTLFPPVRLRGYLELRFLDMSPPRWWPAVAAVAATLIDDPRAADAAAEACEPAAALWQEAARDGLRQPVIAESAQRCMAIAATFAAAELAGPIADLAELVASGRCPGDELAERISAVGPWVAFEEAAHA